MSDDAQDATQTLLEKLVARERARAWDLVRYEGDADAQAFVAAHPRGATLEEIAQYYGVSRERIRQIEEQALAKLVKRCQLAGITRADLIEHYARIAQYDTGTHVMTEGT